MLGYEWEFNVLGIANYRAPGKLSTYYQWLRENADKIPGDVFEAGVFEGKSLLGTALLLKEIGSDKKVIGFDSFAGFPPVFHENDNFEKFTLLHKQGRISAAHLEAHQKLIRYRGFLKNVAINPENISSSESFAASNRRSIEEKAAFLELDNIVLVEGSFADTMREAGPVQADRNYCCALFDCDLYLSYQMALQYLWPRLSKGGFIFLDEYFSLKFPGARIACDEFFEAAQQKPERLPQNGDFFERWGVVK